MPKKSVFAQLEAVAVPPHNLLASPRHWNPGLLRYRERVWLGYRFHRADTPDARCSIAICEIDPETGNPVGESQRLGLSDPTKTGHQEDCRFFLFRGEPYISYTNMVGYRPGIDYSCTVKYAKLRLMGKRWSIVEEWQPVFGENNGFRKEKNWVFFEHEHELYFIYAVAPEHIVVKVEGEKAAQEFKTVGAEWQWGHLRGGTPPVDLGDGRMMAVFHSSIPTEEPPHFVRYYAAAYTFEKKPPFCVLQISAQPILAGSEEDGHRVDPRYVQGWKPYVVFPGGLIPDKSGWLMALGINDWQCAVARLTATQLLLGAPDGSSFKPRFFKTGNGTLPVRYVDAHQHPVFLHWEIVANRRSCSAGAGYMQAAKAREAVEVSEVPGIAEISESEYRAAMRQRELLLR